MISLNNYVKRRNGVSLGHPNSLVNMLKRSFGANSFDVFWVHWNPIWNYYLNKYIYKPIERISNRYVAVILTFCFSGFIHDLVGLLIYNSTSFLFTVWFIIMGILVTFFKAQRFIYKTNKKEFNYCINSILILTSFLLSKYIINVSNFLN